jgi:hypothetical protein
MAPLARSPGGNRRQPAEQRLGPSMSDYLDILERANEGEYIAEEN